MGRVSVLHRLSRGHDRACGLDHFHAMRAVSRSFAAAAATAAAATAAAATAAAAAAAWQLPGKLLRRRSLRAGYKLGKLIQHRVQFI